MDGEVEGGGCGVREEGCTKTEEEKGFLNFLPSDGTRFGGASADAAESYRAATHRNIVLDFESL